MATVADETVFENSVSPQESLNLFEDKKWSYITDSTSSNGVFSGQIQFDLNTLSSQNQWTNLSEAIIQFPVKLTISNKAAVAPADLTINAATIKNGFHQFVDSVQIVIGGNTVQASQIYTNIDTNYKILTSWSQDTLKTWGPSLGVALDDIIGNTDTDTGVADSVDNLPLTTSATATAKGFDMWSSKNPGIKDRLLHFNNNTASTTLGKSILGNNQSVLGKSNVQANSSNTIDTDVFCLYALGTIRLKDISDAISKMPLIKGMKGFIYLNYNSTESVISNTGAASAITSVATNTRYGRCCPAMYNDGADGISLSAAATAPVLFKADISGVPSVGCPLAVSTQTNAVLHCPYYIGTPEIDRELTMKKTIRYNERFSTQFEIGANSHYNATLSPGISNPKRVILYPFFKGAGSSGNTGFIANPLQSPFDSTPSTTSPFAALKDLQLYVGNKPMFQSPVSMDWQTFLNEVNMNGLDGGLNDEDASGLLNQRTWNQLYRYYTCNIARRMNSEDGASKSIQVSASNATNCPMTVIAIIHYEKEIEVDTASGMVKQTM